MAKAPDPAKVARQRERERRQAIDKTITLTYDGRPLTLSFADLGPADDRASSQQTGLAITGVFLALEAGQIAQIGLQVAYLIVWMARRKNGEPDLSYQDFEAAVPTYKQLAEHLGGDLSTALSVEDADPGEG